MRASLSTAALADSPRSLFRFALVLLPLGLGCGSESFMPKPPAEPNELYWQLTLNHRAVLLATTASYDTLTLVATPRNAQGEALSGLPQAQYASSDVEKVTVTPDGVLHAVASTPPGTTVTVTATLTAGNLKYTDQVAVHVIDGNTPPVLASLSIHPLPPDSAKVAVTSTATAGVDFEDTLLIRAVDAAGTPIPTIPGNADGVLPVDLRAADSSIAFGQYDRTVIKGYRIGTTKIYASTTALGVTWADTLQYRVGLPVVGIIYVTPTGVSPASSPSPVTMVGNVFSITEMTIGVGGVVWWSDAIDTMPQIDIHFAEANASNVASFEPPPGFIASSQLAWLSSACSGTFFVSADCNSGDALFSPNGHRFAFRTFPVPGTYEYSSTKYPGSGGRIVVVDER